MPAGQAVINNDENACPQLGQDLGSQRMPAPLKQGQTQSKCVEGSCHLPTLQSPSGSRRYASEHIRLFQPYAPHDRFRATTCARRPGAYGRKSDTPDPRRRRIRACASRIPPASLVCLHDPTVQNSAQAHVHSA